MRLRSHAGVYDLAVGVLDTDSEQIRPPFHQNRGSVSLEGRGVTDSAFMISRVGSCAKLKTRDLGLGSTSDSDPQQTQ